MGSAQSVPVTQIRHEALLDKPLDGVRYRIEFEGQYFAKGSCRLAFRGSYRGGGPKDGQRCVTKISADGGGKRAADYEADMRASRKAQRLANYFNQDYVSSKPIRFLLPLMATVVRVSEPNLLVRPGDKILVEDFIEGEYEKFNNNTSYRNDDVATVPCFSHYTYYKTGGQYLACDIQGVRTPTGYVLTDPAIHSRTGEPFGDTDLGPDGFVRFFSSHRCTDVCVLFPISDLQGGRDLPERRVDTTRKNYCGGRLNGPACACCNDTCGPRNGCNCADCMRRDLGDFGLENVRALVNREGAVSKLSRENGKFYCGRKNMSRDSMTDGFCGPVNGNNCHACRQLDIQATGRYASITSQWYSGTGQAAPTPSSVIYPR